MRTLRALRLLSGAALLLLVCAHSADAHRLDEILQTARISLEPGEVVVELDFTPGVEVAEQVQQAIDRDRDGHFSAQEAAAFATSMVENLQFEVDGVPRPLRLDHYRAPSEEEILTGVGVLRMRASAAMPALREGQHLLRFGNSYRQDISVYLVNALIPRDDRFRITGQRRDSLQRQFDMDFVVTPETAGFDSVALLPLLGFGFAGGLYWVSSKLKSAPGI